MSGFRRALLLASGLNAQFLGAGAAAKRPRRTICRWDDCLRRGPSVGSSSHSREPGFVELRLFGV